MDAEFLVRAIAYMAAAIVCVPLARRLGLGSVLGYLIAGVLIGPSVLQVIGAEGKEIMHMAEFGVVIMLFLIGLELEPQRLWKLRHTIAGAGSVQLLATSILITVAGIVLGLPWQSSIAIGLALAMSSTAIVLQSLKEQGALADPVGRLSFSILLFQDIAVIPILALLPLISIVGPTLVAGGHGNVLDSLPGWLHAMVMLFAISSVVILGRYAVVPVMRVVARANVRELFIAAALLIVVAIAWLMTMVGLSPALGTFLAGVVLANSEFRHELESDLEPLKGLLLGLFFMAVGAGINMPLILVDPLNVLGVVAGIVLVKALVLAVVAYRMRLASDQTIHTAIGMSQAGEFAFVVMSFALQQGVVEEETAGIVVAATAISMASTPVLMLIAKRWVLPRLVAGTEEERETDAANEYNEVLIIGFSHFGSTIGRFLRANGVAATVLDNDADRVDLLRKMGFRVFYGDATRKDVLHAAGAESARIAVLAVDDTNTTNAIVELLQHHYAHLELYVRTQHRYHTYELMQMGIPKSYRQGVDTAVRMGVDVLRGLGFRAHSASRSGQAFLRYDEAALAVLAPHHSNISSYVQQVREQVAEQERLLLSDISQDHTNTDPSWDSAPLREALGGTADPEQ